MRTRRAHDRHGPGKSARCNVLPEPHLDIPRRIGRHLDLRRLQEHRRHAETKFALDGVLGPARQHAGTRANGRTVAQRDGYAIRFDTHVRDSSPGEKLDAGVPRGREECPVQCGAVDDYRLGCFGRVADRCAVWCEEPHRPQRIEYDVPRNDRIIEGFGSEYTGAMHRLTAGRMLFEEDNVETLTGE